MHSSNFKRCYLITFGEHGVILKQFLGIGKCETHYRSVPALLLAINCGGLVGYSLHLAVFPFINCRCTSWTFCLITDIMHWLLNDIHIQDYQAYLFDRWDLQGHC